jgi:hypothetical protein
MQKVLKGDLVSEQFCTDTAQSPGLGCRRRLLQVRAEPTFPLHNAIRRHAPHICSMAQRENLTRAMTRQLLRGAMTRARFPRPSQTKVARKVSKNGRFRAEGRGDPLKVDRTLLEG